MTQRTMVATNPLSRAAEMFSGASLRGVEVVARVAGAGLALLYAWSQYGEFDRVFERTWVFCVAIAVLGLVPVVLPRSAVGLVARGVGAAALLFGGAMLARELEGMGVLVAGVVALGASLALESRERGSGWLTTLGLAAGAALTFAVAIGTALLPA